ncbi:hypothetical protein ACA910_008769 [Epithemia clementina (nom. ined.)]
MSGNALRKGATAAAKGALRKGGAAVGKGGAAAGKKSGSNLRNKITFTLEDALVDRNSHKNHHRWHRAHKITPSMIGMTVPVHSGRDFKPVTILDDMVGHKLGEYVSTRTFGGHAEPKISTKPRSMNRKKAAAAAAAEREGQQQMQQQALDEKKRK